MEEKREAEPPFEAIGRRIREFRTRKGLTRRELAEAVQVDVSSVSGWEGGKRLPREKFQIKLADILETDRTVLFNGAEKTSAPVVASLVDTMEELPGALMQLTRGARHLRAMRLAAPYCTPAHVQVEWRQYVHDRILGGSLEVSRVEILYDLKRLKEVLSNVIRYDGRKYWVKSYCAGLDEVVPAMGGYIFDDDAILLGAYWTEIPPHNRSGLMMIGEPFKTYYTQYWDEVWRRGRLMNAQGAHGLSALREVALTLGLSHDEWPSFVEEARCHEVGDGAPPLI